ncbi:MAG: alpha/beta fold hydrolase [Flavobacteriales bacterium]
MKPTVVLLHGFLGDHTVWGEITASLGKTHSVFTPDLLGHGKRPVVAKIHTMEMMAEDVKNQLGEGNSERFFLVGHSMGGYVALAFAKLFPQKVSGLCLFNSTAYPDSPQRQKDRLRAAKIVEQNPEIFIREAIPALYYEKNHRALKNKIEQYKEIAMSTPRKGIIAAILGMKDRQDQTELILNGRFPVLYLAGEHDQSVTAESVIEQTLDTPAEVHIFENCAHMGFDERPAEYLKALEGFLNQI